MLIVKGSGECPVCWAQFEGEHECPPNRIAATKRVKAKIEKAKAKGYTGEVLTTYLRRLVAEEKRKLKYEKAD